MEGGMFSGCGIAVTSLFLFLVGLVLFFWAVEELKQGRWIGDALNNVLKVLVVAVVLVVALVTGVRAAGAVARERQGQTIDALLVLPVNRQEILLAKWLAPFFWVRYPLLGLLGCATVALLLGGVHPLGYIATVVYVVGLLAFFVTLGLWLSVRCRSATRATVYFIVWSLSLVFLPVVLTPFGEMFGFDNVTARFSPPVTLWYGLFGWSQFNNDYEYETCWISILTCTAAGVVLAGMAWVLWVSAVRTFEREGK
ncbi:ABC transporter permease [Fimbriiglobus ruber]